MQKYIFFINFAFIIFNYMKKDRVIRKILIIRFRRVGDAVISTVLCSSLKKTFPEAKIHYVLNDNIAPLFEHHPDIDAIIRFSNEDMKTWWTYAANVKHLVSEEKYDMIVDTRSTIKTLWFSFFSMRTPYRVGKKKAYNPVLHNYRTSIDGAIDEVTKTLMLLKPLEKQFDIQYERNFKLYITREEQENFRSKMIASGIDFSKPIIVCAVAARLNHKIWNMDNMRRILCKIIDKYHAQLIFNFGGQEEKDVALRLHRDMENHSNVFTHIEAHNLRELGAMISLSGFFFGIEGGPRHIAQALDVPSFAIYPPGIPKAEWLPNACERFQGIEPADVSVHANNHNLSFSKKFELITADAVWERLEPMLDKFIVI